MIREILAESGIEPLQTTLYPNFVGTDILRRMVPGEIPLTHASFPGSPGYRARIQRLSNCGALPMAEAAEHYESLLRGEANPRCDQCFFRRALVNATERRVLCPYSVNEESDNPNDALLERYALKVLERYQSRNYPPFVYLGCTDNISTILGKLSEVNQHFGLVNFAAHRSCVNEYLLPHTIIDIYCDTVNAGPRFSISFAAMIEKTTQSYLDAKGKLTDQLDDFMTPIVIKRFKES